MPPVDTHDPWFGRKNLPVRSSPYSMPDDRALRKAPVNTFWHTSTLGSASTSTSTTINQSGHSSHSVAYPSVLQLHTTNSTEPDSATNLQYPQIAEVQAESSAGGHRLDLGPGFNDDILMGPEQLVEDIDEWGNLKFYPDWLRALCEAGSLPSGAAAGDTTTHSNQAEVVEQSAKARRRATVDSIDTQPPLAMSCPMAPSSTSSATSSSTENPTSDNVHPNTVIQTGLALEHALPSPIAIASLTRCSSSYTQTIRSTGNTSTSAASSCANPSNLPWTQSVLATSGALSLPSAEPSQLGSCASCSISMPHELLENSAATPGVPSTAFRVKNSANSCTRFGSFRTVSMPSSVDGQVLTIPVEFPCVTSSWSLLNLDERAPNTSTRSQGEPFSTHVSSDRCPPERQSQLAADVPQRGPASDIHQNGLTFPLQRLQVARIRPWAETTSELLRLAGSFRWRDTLPGHPGRHERAAQSLRHVLEKATWMSSESIQIQMQPRRQAITNVIERIRDIILYIEGEFDSLLLVFAHGFFEQCERYCERLWRRTRFDAAKAFETMREIEEALGQLISLDNGRSPDVQAFTKRREAMEGKYHAAGLEYLRREAEP